MSIIYNAYRYIADKLYYVSEKIIETSTDTIPLLFYAGNGILTGQLCLSFLHGMFTTFDIMIYLLMWNIIPNFFPYSMNAISLFYFLGYHTSAPYWSTYTSILIHIAMTRYYPTSQKKVTRYTLLGMIPAFCYHIFL